MNFLKDIIREILIFLHLDLTKNLTYDRLTRLILKKSLSRDSNCIDIGCHKGEILSSILTLAPQGKHIGFEPIPYLYNRLKEKFDAQAIIYPYALSDTSGETTFQLVKNAPAYSGIKKRRYDIENPDIEEIRVEMKTLDELIPEGQVIHFIKIDVEGAEFGVLKGARRLLATHKPLVLFEFGRGASEFYGTTPSDMYQFINQEAGLRIFTLQDYLVEKSPLSQAEFEKYYESNAEYYFVACLQEII